jgi:hypothetical protein
LTVAWQRLGNRDHTWFVFESARFRVLKSLSDLSGTDIYTHGGTIRGVFQQLCHAFINEERQPSVGEMMAVYRYLKSELATILKASRATSIFDGARPFRDVYIAAALRAEKRV